MDGYNHYIRVNQAGEIIHGYSSAFVEQPEPGDILVLEDGPRHFHEAFQQLNNERGQYRLKWISGELVERTQQELDAEWASRPPVPPSEVELLQAENVELKLALAELAEAQETDKTEIQLALAELADLYTGGV